MITIDTKLALTKRHLNERFCPEKIQKTVTSSGNKRGRERERARVNPALTSHKVSKMSNKIRLILAYFLAELIGTFLLVVGVCIINLIVLTESFLRIFALNSVIAGELRAAAAAAEGQRELFKSNKRCT